MIHFKELCMAEQIKNQVFCSDSFIITMGMEHRGMLSFLLIHLTYNIYLLLLNSFRMQKYIIQQVKIVESLLNNYTNFVLSLIYRNISKKKLWIALKYL